MIRALLIGCGNIGAGYDLSINDVWTHAKAFSKESDISFCVMDRDIIKAKAVGEHYGVEYYTELTDELLSSLDLVSICTPTSSHLTYLNQISKFEHCYCICEKPVVSNLQELKSLQNNTKLGDRTLVNYIRRFQPGFLLLKTRLEQILITDKISAINIKYNRGILNNGGHALDLIHFLFSSLQFFELSNVQILDYNYDSFKDDPTVVATTLLNNNIPIVFNGIKNTEYDIFEIELYFSSHVIRITESGNIIKYFKVKNRGLKRMEDWTQNNVMKDYMIPVLEHTLALMNRTAESNFTEALFINKIILEQFLNQI